MFVPRSFRDDFYDTIKTENRIRRYYGYNATEEVGDPSYIMEFHPNGFVTIANFSNSSLKLAIYRDDLEKYGLKKNLWEIGYENISGDEEWDKFREGELTEAFEVLKKAFNHAVEMQNQYL